MVEAKCPTDDLGVSEDRKANDIGEPNRVSNLRLGGWCLDEHPL